MLDLLKTLIADFHARGVQGRVIRRDPVIPLDANVAGEPTPSGGRLDPLVLIDHIFTRSHKDHKANSIFRSGSFPS
ncbi:MAG: hypothetical protein WC381_03660 [Kiritimatiellia bacterium]